MSVDSLTTASDRAPSTPFAETLVTPVPGTEPVRQGEPALARTPFVSEYFAVEGDANAAAADPRSEELVELLDELYDSEFDEVVRELVAEVDDVYRRQFVSYDGSPGANAAAEQFVVQHLAGLQHEAEGLLDRMAAAADEHDPAAMSESELDEFVTRFAVDETGLSPTFEEFLSGIAKKVGGYVKKAAKAVGRIVPIGRILAKLKRLVRPLLSRVLRFALDKLPPAVRPAASQLAARLLRKGAPALAAAAPAPSSATDATDGPQQPAAADPAQLQQELDLGFATLLMASDESEAELGLVEMLAEMEHSGSDALGGLHQARERFIADVNGLADGEDPTPAIQNFIPAILPVLRMGIRLAGRGKVVAFLARFLARYLRRFVGPTSSTPLSRAIVDVGLRMLSLETTPEAGSRAAAAALAGVVEDTVRRVAELDEAVLDSEELLEAAAADAFDAAAGANFPRELMLPEHHESEINGMWVMVPMRGTPRCRRFSNVLDVHLTSQAARRIRSSDGTTLAVLLRDRYGLTGPVDGRVRLYEAVPGSSLTRIAAGEQEGVGLGPVAEMSASDLHPLTPESAGLLMGAPGLGVPTGPVTGTGSIAAGQRFFHLEVPGARARPGGRAARPTRLSVRFLFRQDAIRIRLFLSEADAQAMATLAGKGAAADLTRMMLARVESGVREAASGRWPRRIRFVHEAVPLDYLAGSAIGAVPAPVRQWIGTALRRWVHAAVTDSFLARHGRALVEAAANAADGVTILVVVRRPPGMRAIAGALRGQPVPTLPPLPAPAPAATVTILPGRRR